MAYANPEDKRAWEVANRAKRNAQARARRPILSSVRLLGDQRVELKAKAKAQGKSMAELVRTYIEWGLENDA